MPNDVLLQAMRAVSACRLKWSLPLSKPLPYFHALVSVRPPKAAFETSDFALDAAVEREKHLAIGRDPGHAGRVTIEGEVTDDDAD